MSPKLLITLLLLLAGALYYFVINPLYSGEGTLWQPKSISKLKVEKQQYVQAIIRAEEIVKQADDLKKDYEKISGSDKEKLKLMVPDTIDRTRLLSEMVNMANIINVTLKDLNVSELTKPAAGVPGVYGVGFSVTTSYPRFKDLIRLFETNLRLFQIESVSFGASEKNPDSIEFRVRFNTFYIK